MHSILFSYGDFVAEFSLKGAELVRLTYQGKEKIWCGDPDFWAWHAPVLFPICGGLRENTFRYEDKSYCLQKHGFARHSLFTLETRTENAISFALEDNASTLGVYPFPFKFVITYTFKENSLAVTYAITNKGTAPMPFSIGAHEAYALDDELSSYALVFEKEEHIDLRELDGMLLSHNKTFFAKGQTFPLKEEYFAIDAMIFDKLYSQSITLCHRKTGESVKLDFEGFSHLLVWTIPGARFLALEPWCGMVDYVDADGDLTHKEGILILDPSQTEEKTHCITFT